jgi:hypothetical protein
MAILTVVALLDQHNSLLVLSNLMLTAASFCVIFAEVRHEPIRSPTLTHWDEAVAFALTYLALRHSVSS